jgi:hypothetical integral membrane protein (TIGR02206 family)
MAEFHSFSLLHAVMIGALVAFTWLIVFLRRRFAPARWLDPSLAIIAIVFWMLDHGRWLLPSAFDPALHICNLAGICVPLVLLTNVRLFRTILYFWGLGLSTQSVITPDLVIGPATFGFWMYWINHTIVIAVPIYDVIARGYRPTWRDYRAIMIVSLVYASMMVPLDIALHANYGYLGAGMTKQATLLDYLGHWPLRAVWVVLLGLCVMALVMLPWEIASRIGLRDRALPKITGA